MCVCVRARAPSASRTSKPCRCTPLCMCTCAGARPGGARPACGGLYPQRHRGSARAAAAPGQPARCPAAAAAAGRGDAAQLPLLARARPGLVAHLPGRQQPGDAQPRYVRVRMHVCASMRMWMCACVRTHGACAHAHFLDKHNDDEFVQGGQAFNPNAERPPDRRPGTCMRVQDSRSAGQTYTYRFPSNSCV